MTPYTLTQTWVRMTGCGSGRGAEGGEKVNVPTLKSKRADPYNSVEGGRLLLVLHAAQITAL